MSIEPLSKKYLIDRGSCCKNGCKNCPYDYNKNKKMKEKEKYFTPNTEDIRLGYEAEIAYLHEDNWTPTKWRHEEEVLATISNLLNYNRRIRTPYLTKEQIEAEGWRFAYFPIEIEGTDKDVFIEGWEKTINEDLWYTLRKEGNLLIIEKRWYINQVSQIWETLFRGEIKDINNFRYICKLLNIK